VNQRLAIGETDRFKVGAGNLHTKEGSRFFIWV
jgi:hypothetical protein